MGNENGKNIAIIILSVLLFLSVSIGTLMMIGSQEMISEVEIELYDCYNSYEELYDEYLDQIVTSQGIYEITYGEILYVNKFGEVYYGIPSENKCHYVENNELFYTEVE